MALVNRRIYQWIFYPWWCAFSSYACFVPLINFCSKSYKSSIQLQLLLKPPNLQI
jgi:hypothetical protein